MVSNFRSQKTSRDSSHFSNLWTLKSQQSQFTVLLAPELGPVIIAKRMQPGWVCRHDTHTHTCSELSLRILLWSASDVQKQSSYIWHDGLVRSERKIPSSPPWRIASSVHVLNSNSEMILVEKRHGGSWVSHIPSRFKDCRYVCTATWMGLRWLMPSKCPWAPCWNQKAEKEATVEVLLLSRSSTHTHTHRVVSV